jgi:hypothetical protein
VTQELAAEARGHHVEHPDRHPHTETSHKPSKEHKWHHYKLANPDHREGNTIPHHIVVVVVVVVKKQWFRHTGHN